MDKIKINNSLNLIEEHNNKYNGSLALSTSLSIEDQVVTDLLLQINTKAEIFTLDTGRIPEETHKLIDRTNYKYDIKIKSFFPNYEDVEKLSNEHGSFPFYESIEKRKLCCKIRKIEPLKRALKPYSVWLTGLRREQSITRKDLPETEYDEFFNIIKVNPIADWSEENVWEYIKSKNIPYNQLYKQNYLSIGCEPCTRPVIEGEDIRSGRWWWENPETKECGLHAR